MNRVEKEIRRLVGSYIFADGTLSMEEVVGRILHEKRRTLSVAESCTGGLIGHRLTEVPGSSEYFQGDMIVYSNQSKIDLLGVSSDIIEKYGAVSDQTAKEMARGVREHFKTDMGVAVTGIAGPDGGTKEKPVGTVHIGLATADTVTSAKYRFWGNREQIKIIASMMALDWVRRYYNGDPFLPGI